MAIWQHLCSDDTTLQSLPANVGESNCVDLLLAYKFDQQMKTIDFWHAQGNPSVHLSLLREGTG